MLFAYFVNWLRTRPRPQRRPFARPRYARPTLEPLEDRFVPAQVVINPIGNQIVAANNPLTVQVQASVQGFQPILGFQLIGPNPGAVLNLTTGVFQFTPTPAQAGQTLQFTVMGFVQKNPDITPGTQSFNVTVAPPLLNAIPNQTVTPGQTVSLMAVGHTAAAGEPLVYSLTQAPAGATINPTTGQFTWTPVATAGVVAVTVRVNFAGLPTAFAERTFFITVNSGTPPNGFVNNVLLAVINATPTVRAATTHATSGFIGLAVPLPPQFVGLHQAPPATVPEGGGGGDGEAANSRLTPFTASLDLPLSLDRASPRPLRLSDTESNSDGSSVERLYKDFFSQAPPEEEMIEMEDANAVDPTDAADQPPLPDEE